MPRTTSKDDSSYTKEKLLLNFLEVGDFFSGARKIELEKEALDSDEVIQSWINNVLIILITIFLAV